MQQVTIGLGEAGLLVDQVRGCAVCKHGDKADRSLQRVNRDISRAVADLRCWGQDWNVKPLKLTMYKVHT